MRKVILITFAGRKDRMELLRTYALKLLDKGLLDEWHVWDFTRNDKDREYIRKNYGPIQYIRPHGGISILLLFNGISIKSFLSL